MIQIDRFMDILIARDDADFDYSISSRRYMKKHGHGVYIGVTKGHDAQHIEYAYHAVERAQDQVSALFDVLGLDDEQRERAYSAGRFMKAWYDRTQWERLPSQEMLNRTWAYILG